MTTALPRTLDRVDFPEELWHSLLPGLVSLRAHLHQHPEFSEEEAATAASIRTYLLDQGLEPLAEGVGGTGLLYRIDGPEAGPVTLIRADMDALPLMEASGAPHASVRPGLHHACGHDGHSTMLAGTLAMLHRHRDRLRGHVYGLFQPAEEIGTGMAACLEHPALRTLHVDRAFALHNLPGAPFGTVVLPRGAAAAASTGLRIRLEGARSHSSEPHLARNPIHALAQLVPLIQAAPTRLPFGHAALATLVHLEAASDSFGTNADTGHLHAILRAYAQADLDEMVAYVRSQVERCAIAAGLDSAFELVEPFPATVNHDAAFAEVARAAQQAGLDVSFPERPFPWSEDFGHATRRWPGALFGLGAGETQPPLHSARYDFPDALLTHGVRAWWALAIGAAA